LDIKIDFNLLAATSSILDKRFYALSAIAITRQQNITTLQTFFLSSIHKTMAYKRLNWYRHVMRRKENYVTRRVIIIIIILFVAPSLPFGLHIRRTSHNPPRGPGADWWQMQPKPIERDRIREHGGPRCNKFLVTHQMTDLCERCLSSARRAH
jgi:hypothetical protein